MGGGVVIARTGTHERGAFLVLVPSYGTERKKNQ